MRQIAKALAFIAALLPSLAAAQSQLPTLPANTVLGRLGISSGPAQAIPFSQLGPSLITNNLAVTPPLAISGLSLTITGSAGKVLGGASPAFTSTPTLGVASSLSGTLTLANSGNSGTVTLAAPSTATTWTLKFPTTAGSNGQAMITDGSGNTSWAAGAGTVNSGTAGQLGYYATTAAALSGNANLTISGGALTIGVPNSQVGTLVLAGSTSGSTNINSSAIATGNITIPAATDTLVARNTTDTLTNKTLTSPAINTPTVTGGAISALTGLAIRDTSAAFDVTLGATSTSSALTAGRALTLDVGNVAHTVQFGTTANTITFPNVASDTVTMLAAAQSVSNKTITLSTYNGNTWTAGTGTLSIAAGKTLTASNSLTFTGSDGNSFAFPSGSDTVVTLAAAQSLSNKTLTAPTINGGTAQALTNVGIRSTGSGAFDLVLANSENLTAQRTMTLTLNNANRTINMSGNLTLAAGFTTAGGSAVTLTTTGATNVNLPTSGTLATTDTAQTFSGSDVFSALTQFTDIKFSSGKLYPTADSTTALQIMKSDGLTSFVTFDSTNKRVGINKTPGAFDLDVTGAVNVGTTLTFGTLDATSLGTSTSTVTGLTVNNSPNSSNDYIPYFSAADGRIRRATVGSIAAGATAGVSSLNGLIGGLSVATSGASNVAASGTTVTIATPDYFYPQNCTLAASVASNLLTVALKDNAGADPSVTSPCRIPFRSATATTGSTTIDSVTAALSISTNATGATLGTSNNAAFRFWVVAFDNAGTAVLALINCSTSTQIFALNEGAVASTTAISGSATSAGVFYTPNGTTLASKAFRILGYVEYNSTGLATAGTYATAPNFVQTFGPGIRKPGEPVGNLISVNNGAGSSVSSASYTDVTGVTASITPTSAANSIRVSFTGYGNVTAAGAGTNSEYAAQLLRTATTISSGQIGVISGTGTNIQSEGFVALSAFDSPNTASSTTYKVQHKYISSGVPTVTTTTLNFIVEEIMR